MKTELLQSLSVFVLIAGLFLSALGGLGAYYFSGKGGPSDSRRESAAVKIAEPDLPVRQEEPDARLAAIVEPVAEPVPPAPPEAKLPSVKADPIAELPLPPIASATVRHPAPQETKPPPVAPEQVVELPPPPAEKMDAPAEAVPVTPAQIVLEPEPAVPTTAIPVKEPPTESAPERPGGLGIAPWQLEKMLQRLRTFKHGTIAIQAPEGSDEARQYAGALKEAFVTAGWSVTGVDAVKTNRELKGITLSSGTFPPPTEVTTVFGSLVTAGIKVATDLDPSLGKGKAVLFVGSRP